MQTTNTEPAYLSVSEVVQLLQMVLDQAVPQLTFLAEISEITRAASGHLYLTLKDERCQMSAVMWKGSVRTLGFAPERGMAVHCFGKPAIYAANGRLQVVLSHLAPAGEGLLRKKFLELRARLEQEGLFLSQRKRPIPYLPRAIGIVTSQTGAVIHDMMVKLKERMPQVPIFLMDVRVQGEGAAVEIAAAIEYLSQSELVDVLIVARGGGSLEDLWAFNEEVVVRAIFASRIPVVSGVGHEVDVTLADLVADVRAPTPTAAAEIVVPHRTELLRRIDQIDQRLANADRWYMPLAQRVDEIDIALQRRVATRLESIRMVLGARMVLLEKIRPVALLERNRMKLEMFQQRLRGSIVSQTELQHSRLDTTAARLEGVSPRRTLERGFAIVEHQGQVLRDASKANPGELLRVRLHHGVLETKITRTFTEGSES